MYTFSSLKLTLISTTIAMISTILGASCVLFIKNNLSIKYYKIFLGFTAGMMISSSIWSLLIPATELSDNKLTNLFSITLGFILGALSFKLTDKFISSIILKNNLPISMSLKKKSLIILSSALRNMIEGISIGIAFSLSSSQNLTGSLAGAITLSIAMVLQNFPEGFSLSIPLKNERISTLKSFVIGSIPGLLEPLGGILGIILANKIVSLLPFILSFAAGTIIIVVIDELIPECNSNKSKNHGTIGFILGFILLLMLEIILN
ncbi:MAG TPA: ZIP family metal transporter [Candidatus Dwaynia gallinarum]|nr:ZIP family metal transporter [Candidatus Dwaynia gallinarum]